jgi:hypothetical protein
MSEPSLSENLWAFAKQRFYTLELFPDYLHSVIEHWNDIYLSIPALPFVAWWYLGEPPMWLKGIVFLWVLLVAGYYAWRAEHLKVISERFTTWISQMCTSDGRLFVQLRITNVGPPTSIHTWQGGFRNADGRYIGWAHDLFADDERIPIPKEMRGDNLIRDLRLFATGETREGWLARDIGLMALEDMRPIFQTITFQFTDAFDNVHRIDTLLGKRK